MTDNCLTAVIDYLQKTFTIEVAWLYGSRATGTYTDNSDYDIAVALSDQVQRRSETTENLCYDLGRLLSLPVSVIDINRIPVPLAQNVIAQGQVIVCKSDFRLRMEQQRIWSLWESYKYEHEHNRKAL